MNIRWFFQMVLAGMVIGVPCALAAEEAEYESLTIPLHFAEEESSCFFTAPSGWQYVDTSSLPQTIKLFVRGKSESEVPPTLNLAVESTSLDLEHYLTAARNAYCSTGYAQWCQLGTIDTESGECRLTQIEQETEWGIVKIMQAIMVRNHTAYVLSASALKAEFPNYYEEFFQSIQSFTIKENPLEMVKADDKRLALESACQRLKAHWFASFDKSRLAKPDLPEETVAIVAFEQPQFQEAFWRPFQQMICESYEEMGTDWQSLVLNQMHEELLRARPEEENAAMR